MNYTHSAAAEYQQTFSSLPTWLQEETLDELEQLLAHPEQLTLRGADGLAVRDFARKADGVSHLVFLTIRPNPTSRILNLVRLGNIERQ